jgi:hypothetical protein
MVVGMIPVEPVPTITSTVTTRIWMDRNLGVDQGLIINTIKTDFRFYGSLYQWGRASDGHQIIRWNSSTSGTPKWQYWYTGDKQTC